MTADDRLGCFLWGLWLTALVGGIVVAGVEWFQPQWAFGLDIAEGVYLLLVSGLYLLVGVVGIGLAAKMDSLTQFVITWGVFFLVGGVALLVRGVSAWPASTPF
jgi:hypothetical protein